MAIPLIERLLDEADTSQAAAGVVALAADEGGVFYQGARGRIGPDVATPIALDSIFRIASMTKAITSTAAMQLVEDGKVDLDQAMRAIVSELGEVKVLLGFDSGFSCDLFNRDVARYMRHEGLPSIVTCMNASLRAPLLFEPGERWEYGVGIDLVGRIVEAERMKPRGLSAGHYVNQYLPYHVRSNASDGTG
jgi:methyl acetate hydrolase